MDADLFRAIADFERLTLLVIGEAMLDAFLNGPSTRLCQEAPVPVVAVAARRDVPGGAANTAANVRALGGRAVLLSVVGDDAEATILSKALAARDVDPGDLVVQSGRRTLAKQRVSAAGHLLVRFDQGDGDAVSAATERQLIDRLRGHWHDVDGVLISDYQYGILTPAVVEALVELQAVHPKLLAVDARTLTRYRQLRPMLVKPNFQEALRLLGRAEPVDRPDRADAALGLGADVLERTGARIAAITLDADGAVVCERGQPAYRTYAHPCPHPQPAGAGDTYITAFLLGLAADLHTPAAAELAAAAAGVVVGHDTTTTCTPAELRAALVGGEKLVADLAELERLAESYRRQGRRIVFTNGCFDLLHCGHITFLSRARGSEDVLIVGINADASIRRVKGPGRPINSLEDRVQVLAALSCVDHIVAFEEDSPEELIRAIRPDVFTKGGNYTRERLPEAALVEELGGTVKILPYTTNGSTTGIIERIRAGSARVA
jgi:D-beta-D-heptose 7-phosphate kinase/D-beta-D-heptose 1-phosphate adenosyltransferase